MSDASHPSSPAETGSFIGAMSEANPYINLLFDAQRRLLDCNPAAVEYFGFESKEALLSGLVSLLDKSVPEFQPDASPTIPLSTRFAYVETHGAIEFEIELVLRNKRVPMRFTMKRLSYRESYVFAVYILDMQTLKEARNELMRQDFLMRQVNNAATKLMTVTTERFDTVVERILKTLAQSVYAEQMSIWENFERDGVLWCRALYSWGYDARTMSVDANTAELPYDVLSDWYALLSANKNINDQTKNLSLAGKESFIPKGTRAVMVIPVFLRNDFWGFITLNKNSGETVFSTIEEKVIQSGGILVVSAILRNQINQSLIAAREAARASDRAKSDFLSRMSHEIRTPMNAIIGMTAIAQKSQDLERMHYSLDKISAASQQLLQIINDILDMSKIESGKFETVAAPFNFIQMLHGIFNMMQVRLDEKQQQFTFIAEDSFDRMMVSDELRLSQVVLNLLTNAVKFTPNGGSITVTAGYTAGEDGQYRLCMSVEDTGIGVSEEQQAKMFRSFEQADGSITRRFGGTGLGLSICKHITEMLGGDISLQSTVGKGSVFTFHIAFTWGDPVEAHATAAPAPADQSVYRFPGKHILLAEDVAINREILLSILEDTELVIDCAENGLQAVALFEADPARYDMILMDIQMPEMDGLQATRKIRAMPVPQAKEVPILAMTANAFKEDVDKCLEAGMHDHIAKPIDIESLMLILSAYLS